MLFRSPSFVELHALPTLKDKLEKLVRAPWGMNTNFKAVFDLILRVVDENNLTSEHLPKRLFVLSDMQFDEAGSNREREYRFNNGCSFSGAGSNRKTNYQAIKLMFNDRGLTMPQLVFWNINGSSKDFPVTIHDSGTLLISGFSTSIVKYILEVDELTPTSIMNHIFRSSRYSQVLNALK